MPRTARYVMIEVGRIPLHGTRALTPGELRSRIDALVQKIPESERAVATVRVEALPEHLYGDTENVDMDDVRCYPDLVVQYPQWTF